MLRFYLTGLLRILSTSITYCSIIGLPIHILTLYLNPYQSLWEDSRFNFSIMPPKTKSTPTLNSNTPITRRQNALQSSTDKTLNTPAESKLPFKF